MITCVGAAHVDEIARLEHALHPGASNPARWSQTIGGVAANACRAAAEQTDAILIAAVGADAAGAQLGTYFRSLLPSQPANALHTVRDTATGRYCAVLDQHGELVIGLAETDIAEQLTFTDISNNLPDDQDEASILLFDTNLSHACLRDLCTKKPAPVLIALTVSPVKAMRLTDHAASIDILLTNRREAAALTGMPVTSETLKLSAALATAGFVQHVLTDGTNDIVVRSAPGTDIVPVTADTPVAGVNGAGDALAGATAAGLAQGLTLLDAVALHGTVAAHRIITAASKAPELSGTLLPGSHE